MQQNETKSDNSYLLVDGKVVKTINASNFIVEIKNGMQIPASVCGKMNYNYIRVIEGDHVVVKISRYNRNQGIITFRKLKK
jgi:translation initiation factor IF-1